MNGKKTEVYLCDTCMKEHGDQFLQQQAAMFSINPLLTGLLNQEQFLAEKQQSVYAQQELLQCPKCSITYRQFLNAGKIGCAECYKTFDKQITPVLRRIHNGNETHVGKIPKRVGGNIHIQREIRSLRDVLEKQIQEEAFEDAAKTRDTIKQLEKQLSNQ